MANSDKNIVITPNTGSASYPTIAFTGSNASPITMSILDTGALSFSGTSGQLFSIVDSLSGSIFSVNDISGIPSVEVLDTGLIKLNQYGGSTVFGSATAIQSSSANAKVSISTVSAATPGLIVKAVSSQTANLIEWQNSSGSTLGSINSEGSITSANRIISPGDFEARGNSFYGGPSFNVATLNVNTRATTQMGIVVRGVASQTTNLQEWQNSAGTVLSSITSSGLINTTIGLNANALYIGNGYLGANIQAAFSSSSASYVPIVIRGAASQTANLQEWQDSAGNVLLNVDAPNTLGAGVGAFLRFTSGGVGGIKWGGNTIYSIGAIGGQTSVMYPYAANRTAIIIQGAASQTADLQQWQNSAGTVLTSISSTGKLTSLVDGNFNGVRIGLGNSNVVTNLAVGYNALNANTTGDSNLAIGSNALYSNTTGFNNVALGQNTLIAATTANSSVAVGRYTLSSVTTGSYNTGVGSASLNNTTTGQANIAIGVGTMYSNVSGGSNVAIGNTALTSNTGSYLNVAIGDGAGYSATGAGNIFIGYNAGYNETGANKLYIANSNTSTPLIGGDFSVKTLSFAGNATVTSQATGTVGLIVKGSASQTADLQQWQRSNGTTDLLVTNFGAIISGGGTTIASNPTINAYGAAMVINSGVNTYPMLILKGAASQTANLQEWQNSAGTVIASIGPAGDMSANGSFYTNNAFFGGAASYYNATINIRPQQTSYKGIVIQARASQTGNLQEWQNSAGTVMSSIGSNGDFYYGSSRLGADYGQLFLRNATDYGAAANILTGYFGTKGLVIRGVASQTANLQEWQNSAGTAVASMDVSGKLIVPTLRGPAGNVITLGEDGNPYSLSISAAQFDSYGPVPWRSYNTSMVGFIIKGLASQTADLQQWQNSAGTVVGRLNAGSNLGVSYLDSISSLGPYLYTGYNEGFQLINRNAGHIPLKIEGAASQTANLQEWQNSAGTVLAKVDKDGNVNTSSSFVQTGTIGTAYAIDASGNQATYAANATVNFPNFSGMILIDCQLDGTLSLWLCGGGAAARIGGSKAGGYDGSVAYNSGISGYTWTNANTSQNVNITAVRTRSAG